MEVRKRKKLKSSVRFQKRAIRAVGKWKPVDIDPSLFGDEQLESLVCFEELTDYELVSSSKLSEKEKKAQKRKSDASSAEAKEDEEPRPQKKKKKRRNPKDEGTKAAEISSGEDEEFQVFQEVEQQDVVNVEEEDRTDETGGAGRPRALKAPKGKKKMKEKRKTQTPPGAPPTSGVPGKGKNWTTRALSGSADGKTDVSAWKGLFVPKPVLRALSSLGFEAPTPIQALTLTPAIRDNLDILGAAETGSGKTLAFAIPMIHSVLQWRKENDTKASDGNGPGCQDASWDPALDSDAEGDGSNGDQSGPVGSQTEPRDPKSELGDGAGAAPGAKKARFLLGLVLTPTRELAVQVKNHIDAVARFTGIKTVLLVGGMAAQKQQRVLNLRPEIVIATPGRLWELIQEKHPHLSNLRRLRCLVIDEADRMVEKGHFAELSQLLEMLNDSQYNPRRQTFVFSATLTLVHEVPARVFQKKKNAHKLDTKTKLDQLVQKIGMRGKPKVVDLTRKEATVEALTETRIHCEAEEKDFYLYYFLLRYLGRTMVFANSIDCIKRLTALLTILELDPLPLHANMHQKQRLKNLERFAEREACVLLTTDVAARGLDIPNIQHVIHYQVPRTSEIYVHRSGRTARAAKEGLSLLLIGPNDMLNFRKIYKTLQKDEEIPFFPVETKCMAVIKERVNVARKIEKEEYYNSRAKQHNSWCQQVAEALEVDLSEDILMGGKSNEQEESQKQRMMKGMKKHLKHLLSQPVFRNLIKTKYPTQSGKLVLPTWTLSGKESALGTLSKQKKRKKKKGN
ncbi:ATP-dependent RNA helicase DDX24 [Tachyglossus aculeatus]|uniref:ATP-dependent RNA helicase DDX24 n=1 Tax=Tachyglossus aculeatus TaxID=9261 RepID=UPI0018F2D6A9|nr:ATP-dependent RNA helicase DDX24 [Tachyglossus aculeatus]XP_038606485.1 ATP-dependent RNA helicase DDX24 [Tachyglossus aculeatus]